MSKEIKVQRQWIEGLIEYADETSKLSKRNPDYLKIKLPSLLGYIDSAKYLLTINNK